MRPHLSLILNRLFGGPCAAISPRAGRRLAAILLCSVLAISAAAQTKEKRDLLQLSLEELMNIVVTPSKSPQLAGSVTQRVDVIDGRGIERSVSGYRNICDVIAGLPGASVSVLSRNDANWGTYGGIGPKYSTYMLQGLPVDAFIDPMSLDLAAIERIEVQRGPAAVFYPNYLSQDFAGNQSPLAGTINLIPKQKVEARKTLFRTSYGSYNTLNGQLFHQDRGKGLHYFCGAAYEMSEYTDYGAEGSWLNMNKLPGYDKRKAYAGLTWFPGRGERQKLSLFLQGTWHDGDTGRVNQGFAHRYGTLNAGYEIDLNDRLHWQTLFGLRSYFRSWKESAGGSDAAPGAGNGVEQVIVPVAISLSWHPAERHVVSLGVDYQRASYQTWSDPPAGDRAFGNMSEALQVGFYAQEEWRPLEKLLLRAGMRQARIRSRSELVAGSLPQRGSESWSRLLWSLGARYAASPRIAFYANAGSGFAAPGLKSSAGTIPLSAWGVTGRDGQLPNPDLESESGIAVDAGLDLALAGGFRIGVRGFHTRVRDAIIDIVVSRNPSQTRSINAGYSAASGFEVEVARRFGGRCEWFANATFMRSRVGNELDPDQDGAEVPFSPDFIANLGLSWQAPFGLVLAPALHYNAGYFDGTARTGRAFYKPGLVFNLYAAQRVAHGDSYRLEFFAEFYNVSDNRYDMPWQFRDPGFAVEAGIKLTFL